MRRSGGIFVTWPKSRSGSLVGGLVSKRKRRRILKSVCVLFVKSRDRGGRREDKSRGPPEYEVLKVYNRAAGTTS